LRHRGVARARRAIAPCWNSDDIAFLIGTDRWRVADLKRASLERFSLERLIRFLARLDYRVEITLVEERFHKRESSVSKE
jgi:hypothetical protein